jgi:hypothetical protein
MNTTLKISSIAMKQVYTGKRCLIVVLPLDRYLERKRIKPVLLYTSAVILLVPSVFQYGLLESPSGCTPSVQLVSRSNPSISFGGIMEPHG